MFIIFWCEIHFITDRIRWLPTSGLPYICSREETNVNWNQRLFCQLSQSYKCDVSAIINSLHSCRTDHGIQSTIICLWTDGSGPHQFVRIPIYSLQSCAARIVPHSSGVWQSGNAPHTPANTHAIRTAERNWTQKRNYAQLTISAIRAIDGRLNCSIDFVLLDGRWSA